MWIKVGHENAVEINDDVIRGVLNVYPEEELQKRPLFEIGFDCGYISYRELEHECDLIHIPWQMFFLTPSNFQTQNANISNFREYKISEKFFVKRTGVGRVTSKRIIDRLIRLQNFLVMNYKFPRNEFCGAMKGKTQSQCTNIFLDHFKINRSKINSNRQETVLEYLIDLVESKYINVSRGVWRGGILPEVKNTNGVYKNTSGFAVKDEYIPFIFLPDEINPDEVVGRRIYTLVYLLVCIGLDDYDFYLESDFKVSALKNSGSEAKKHAIVGNVLLPEEETEKFRGIKITKGIISELVSRYKITPTATVVILKKRGIIETQDEYESLLPEPYEHKKVPSSPRKPTKVTSSVKKFCGEIAYNFVNEGIKSKTLKSIEAQYLIFGRVRKKEYKDYCSQIGL